MTVSDRKVAGVKQNQAVIYPLDVQCRSLPC